jgi:hypothetical protein
MLGPAKLAAETANQTEIPGLTLAFIKSQKNTVTIIFSS